MLYHVYISLEFFLLFVHINIAVKTINVTPSTSSMDNREVEEKIEQNGEKAGSDISNQEDEKKEDNETINEECDASTRKRQRKCSTSQKDKPVQHSSLYVPRKNGERIL